MTTTVGIAGAGLVGRLLAWQLQRRGMHVCLFEAGSLTEPTAAAYTAAGMIAPVSEAIHGHTDLFKLGNASLQLWPQLLDQLQQDTGQQPDYGQQGSLLVAHSHDISELQQFERDIATKLPTANRQWLDASRIQQLEPMLASQFQQGLFLPHEAHIENRQLLEILLLACCESGVELREQTPVEMYQQTFFAKQHFHKFDLIFDCRGVGAKPQWQEVRGVRGEVMRVHAPGMCLTRPVRLMHPRYQLYVVPKPGHHFVIGATQIESEDRSPVSLQSMLELGSALFTLSAAFAEARILELNTNLRPALSNNLPRIDWQDRCIRINGLYRHGYLLAPIIIDHVSGMLDQRSFLPFAHELGLPSSTVDLHGEETPA